MSKELEMVRAMINGANEYEKKTGDKNPPVYFSKNNLLIIEKALNRLESIDNAEPSEALECLEDLRQECQSTYFENGKKYWTTDKSMDYRCNAIKQALQKTEKEHNSANLLMRELDCKDFAELRKYARCGYQTFRNAKGANYDNIIIDEAQEPKKYLKWEDLEFGVPTSLPTTIKVKMGDTQYCLCLRTSLSDVKSVVLRDNNLKPFLHLFEKEKQFFNDLHLERVEE